MKKLLLAALAAFSISASFGQELSFDELMKLRTGNYPDFETYVHDKGYKLNHLEYDDHCSVFRNGKDVVSYCRYFDNGMSHHHHNAIKFETTSKDEYEKIKRAVEANMKYSKTRMHRYATHHYMEHIYSNDVVTVTLFDVCFQDDDRPYYQVEITSVFSSRRY